MVASLAELAGVRFLDGAAETWLAMSRAIAGARHHIELEIYAFLDDDVGRRFIAQLAEAASRGVEVQVVLDAWGSVGHAGRVVEQLSRRGCKARVHNRLRLGFLGHFNRNHRKLLLVDGEVAVLGGINIGDRFANWADAALELRGAPCRALFRRLLGERFVRQDGPVRIQLSRIAGGRRLRRRYLKAFASAQKRIVLAHSYFLPDNKLMRCLGHAAARGVEVLLLVPAESDVPLAHMASASLYRRLMRRGVRILEYQRGILHAKIAVVDGRRLLLGSFNLDPFSLANLEALVIADDSAVAAQAEAWIERHAVGALPASPPSRWSWLGRIVYRMVVALGRLMRL